MLEAAWQKVTAATNWQALAQDSQQRSDAQIQHQLSTTEVCHAAQQSYFSEDCNLRQSFPPEMVLELVSNQAGAALQGHAQQLFQGAFALGKL